MPAAATVQGKLYRNMLRVDDLSADIPLQMLTPNSFSGGYGIVSEHDMQALGMMTSCFPEP